MAKTNPAQQVRAELNSLRAAHDDVATSAKSTATSVATLIAAAIVKETNPGHMGATGGPYATFGGATDGTTLKANVNTTVGYVNDLAGDVSNLQARYNQLLDLLAAAGVLT
jgi:hypothetical protein